LKIKLDENIGRRGVDVLIRAGFDVMTVAEEGLQGESDEVLFRACAAEGRVLVTPDWDFSHMLRFPPNDTEGIVILDPGPVATITAITQRLEEFVAATRIHSLRTSLWIVEPGRIRIRPTAV
jgi:predicted nuclease of predicted toxin-antitoxin system